MSIDRKTVDKVAGLARLELDAEEAEAMTGQLGRILAFVEKINELDTAGIEPTAHVLDVRNVTRPDIVAPPAATREEMLALAPQAENGFIVVPRVIEQGE